VERSLVACYGNRSVQSTRLHCASHTPGKKNARAHALYQEFFATFLVGNKGDVDTHCGTASTRGRRADMASFSRLSSDVAVLDDLPRLLDALCTAARDTDDATLHGVFLFAGDHALMPERDEAHVTMLESADHERWVVFVDDRPPHTDADGVARCPTPLCVECDSAPDASEASDAGHVTPALAFCHRTFDVDDVGTRRALRAALSVARPSDVRPYTLFVARFNADIARHVAKSDSPSPGHPAWPDDRALERPPPPNVVMRHALYSNATVPLEPRPPRAADASTTSESFETVNTDQSAREEMWIRIGVTSLAAAGAATLVGVLAWAYATHGGRAENTRSSSSSEPTPRTRSSARRRRTTPSSSASRSASPKSAQTSVRSAKRRARVSTRPDAAIALSPLASTDDKSKA